MGGAAGHRAHRHACARCVMAHLPAHRHHWLVVHAANHRSGPAARLGGARLSAVRAGGGEEGTISKRVVPGGSEEEREEGREGGRQKQRERERVCLIEDIGEREGEGVRESVRETQGERDTERERERQRERERERERENVYHQLHLRIDVPAMLWRRIEWW